jgi:ABC-type transport system involved in cytochrome bd biosynthesis fused ATPase/permease subunit
VLDQGRLVQLGSHDELLHQDGLYRQLHEVQTRHSRRPLRGGLADPMARQA